MILLLNYVRLIRHLVDTLSNACPLESVAAQEMVEQHFSDINGVICIHDDLIIAAKDEQSHDKILVEVL